MEEPAWRALSSTAQALYPWLKFEWRGPDANNNGKIQLSVRQAAAKLGVSPDTAAEAFRDLQRKGFIVQTAPACLGFEGAAKSPTYELTELKVPGAEKDGRKLYKTWQPGNDYQVQRSAANNPRGRNGQDLQKTKPCHENHDAPVMKTMTKREALS
jgi:DNA-binding transcriptional MocR family regulator